MRIAEEMFTFCVEY